MGEGYPYEPINVYQCMRGQNQRYIEYYAIEPSDLINDLRRTTINTLQGDIEMEGYPSVLPTEGRECIYHPSLDVLLDKITLRAGGT